MVKTIAFWAFVIAFAIKVPVWPFHTWLPDAHTEAPTAGSMILAGVLLKLGAYGFLRFVLPLYPVQAKNYAGVLAFLAVMAIIFGAFAAYGQSDFKRLVAYSSVNHMGFVVLGINFQQRFCGIPIQLGELLKGFFLLKVLPIEMNRFCLPHQIIPEIFTANHQPLLNGIGLGLRIDFLSFVFLENAKYGIVCCRGFDQHIQQYRQILGMGCTAFQQPVLNSGRQLRIIGYWAGVAILLAFAFPFFQQSSSRMGGVFVSGLFEFYGNKPFRWLLPPVGCRYVLVKKLIHQISCRSSDCTGAPKDETASGNNFQFGSAFQIIKHHRGFSRSNYSANTAWTSSKGTVPSRRHSIEFPSTFTTVLGTA